MNETMQGINWYCHNCKIAGGDYGPIPEASVIFKNVFEVHAKCPGWCIVPPEPKIQEMANQALEESDINPKDAAIQARRLGEKIGKMEVSSWSQGSDFAYHLLDNYHFVTLEDTQKLLMYKDGIYVDNAESIIAKICEDEIKDCKRDLVNEIIAVIKRKTGVPRKIFDTEIYNVCLENCVIDVRDGTITEHTPRKMFRTKLPVRYSRSARCPKFVRFLRQCLPSPEDYIDQVEAFACGLIKNVPKLEAMFFETGKGDNGKSTFLNIINWFYGEENVSTVSIHEFINNKFAKARLENKRINTFPDIESDALDNFGVLKALVSGDAIDAEFKYQNPYTFVNYAKLFFSANELPEIKEKTFATFKRIRLTKWMQSFVKPAEYETRKEILKAKFPDWPESEIISELANSGYHLMNRQFINEILLDENEKSGILNMLLIAVRHIIKRDGFFNDYSHEQLNDLWSENSTMIEAFAKDCIKVNPDAYIEKSKAYQVYHLLARTNGKPPKPDNVFHPVLQSQLGIESTVKRIAGKRVNIYLGYEWNLENPIVKKMNLINVKGVKGVLNNPSPNAKLLEKRFSDASLATHDKLDDQESKP